MEKSLKSDSPSKSSLNTTQDSTNKDFAGKFALNFLPSPALDGDSESEDLDVSLHSLGLDFV